jgi:hypothetical protein
VLNETSFLGISTNFGLKGLKTYRDNSNHRILPKQLVHLDMTVFRVKPQLNSREYYKRTSLEIL